MTIDTGAKDLVVLVADKNMEYAIKGILGRKESLRIRTIEFTIHTHIERDPGCRLNGHEFLRPFTRQYRHALIALDKEGCGKEASSLSEIEDEIEEELSRSGWGERATAIVIDPELEAWVWGDSPNVDEVLGWKGKKPDLRNWLRRKGLLGEDELKPVDPKKAVGEALREVQKPRSSSIYLQLAQKVGLDQCVDPSFVKLKKTLQKWFPLE